MHCQIWLSSHWKDTISWIFTMSMDSFKIIHITIHTIPHFLSIVIKTHGQQKSFIVNFFCVQSQYHVSLKCWSHLPDDFHCKVFKLIVDLPLLILWFFSVSIQKPKDFLTIFSFMQLYSQAEKEGSGSIESYAIVFITM